MRDIRPEDLIFIDETGVNLRMVRLYGRALKGERAIGDRPERQGGNVTLIGAMSLNGMVTALTLDGGIDGNVFQYFALADVSAPPLARCLCRDGQLEFA